MYYLARQVTGTVTEDGQIVIDAGDLPPGEVELIVLYPDGVASHGLVLREDVTPEEAADEIIELLERDDAALRPSELQERLRIPIAVVADGIAVLRQRGWVSGAMTGQPHG